MNASMKSVGTPSLGIMLSVIGLWAYGLTGLPPMPEPVAQAVTGVAIIGVQWLNRRFGK